MMMDSMRPGDTLRWNSLLGALTLLVGVAIILVGLRFLIAPPAGAAGYGLPVDPGQGDGFLLAKGLRDIASGLFVFTLVATASRRVVGLFMMVATVIPIGDAVIVATHAGLQQPLPLSIHGATAAFMAVLATLLISGARGSARA